MNNSKNIEVQTLES